MSESSASFYRNAGRVGSATQRSRASPRPRNADFFCRKAGCARTAFQSTYHLKKNLCPAGAEANAAVAALAQA